MTTGSAISIDAVRKNAERELSPYHGRERIGTVLQLGRSFMAFDLADVHVTTAPSWKDAVKALRGAPA